MTTEPTPLLPLAPHLAPMAEAMAAAEADARRAQEEAAARKDAERQERERAEEVKKDLISIRNAFKRGGMRQALAVGGAYGWSADEIEEAVRRKPKRPKPKPEDDGEEEDSEDAPPPAEGEGGDGDAPPKWKLKKDPIKPLPEDCPVLCLGIDGRICFYLTVSRQFLALDSHSAEALRLLCAGRLDWLWSFIPKFKEQTGVQTNWDAARTADSFIDACGRRGVFDPAQRLRGVGAWRADDGRLILHCGDGVYDGEDWIQPGFIGDLVYPGAAALPRPAAGPPREDDLDALLTLFDSWNWQAEFDVDPETGEPRDIEGAHGHRLSSLLVLGWMAGAMVGGALDWRPALWITGDAASGKSTLQKLIAAMMGGSLVSSSDATAAGIYQSVGYSSRAAAIDEAEADPFSQKMKAMIELVRQSASGGVILRGSNDAKWRGFTARSAFLLSSIVIPPLLSQDMTRITILPLGRLKSTTAPKIEPARYAALGAQLRRRLLDNWPRWQATLDIYRATLASLGHDGRGCDQVGGLLAMADMVRWGPNEPDAGTVSELCAPFDLRNRPREDSNAEQMLNWLISISLDVFRGGTRMTIGTLVAAATGIETIDGASMTGAAAAIAAHGIYCEGVRDEATVTLPNTSAGLARLLEGSPWGTKPGSSMSGWQQAMQRLATARRPDGSQVGRKVNSRRIGGRGWSLPVKVFLRTEGE